MADISSWQQRSDPEIKQIEQQLAKRKDFEYIKNIALHLRLPSLL